jgi:phage baseplate assembly protein W
VNDPGLLFGRGIAFPPRIDASGRVAWSVGEDNVRDAIRILLTTRPGERLFIPDMGAGLDRMLYEPNTVSTRQAIKDRITNTLQQWEPRVGLDDVDVEADPTDPQAAIATISYRLVATQVREQINVKVSLTG